MAESEIHTEDRQVVPPMDNLAEGLCKENPEPPATVIDDAPEVANPTDIFTIEMGAASGRSYDNKEEQAVHREFADTTTPRVAVVVTEEIVFPTMQESATQE
jgi:hypothetical protein